MQSNREEMERKQKNWNDKVDEERREWNERKEEERKLFWGQVSEPVSKDERKPVASKQLTLEAYEAVDRQ